MIPIVRPDEAGHYLRRVVLVRDEAIESPGAEVVSPTVRIRLFHCNGSQRDLLGTFDSAQHKIEDMGEYVLTGSTDLDLRLDVGDVVAVDAERFGFGAPRLKGFGVWWLTVFKGE